MRLPRVLPLVLLLAAGVACTPNAGDRAEPDGIEGSPPRSGGTLRVLLAEDVDALDPQRAAHPPAWGLLRAMHRGLMAFPAEAGPGVTPVPDLAEEPPTVSPDGLRYEFRLREGTAFGPPASRPIVAADVKAGLERAVSASSPIGGYLSVVAGAEAFARGRAREISGIAAPDERTLVITLVRPINDLLWVLATPAASAVPPGLTPVTSPERISPSGPYQLDDGGYRAERSISLVRNLSWNEDSDPVREAWVDGITVEVGVDPAEIQRRLVAGEADLSGDVAPSTEVREDVEPGRFVTAPNGCLRYLFMNTRVAPFTSRRIRVAVQAALSRSAVAEVYAGAAVPAGSILPPTVDGHDPGRVAPAPDPGAARAALDAAGASGLRTSLVVGSRAVDRADAEAVRVALAAAGVRVDVRTVPISNLYEDHYEVPAARVPMGIATWCADWPGLGGRGALAPLVDGRTRAPRGNTNYASLASPSLNALLDAAAAERDRAAAAERWRAADVEAQRHAAVIPLAFLSESSLLGPDVRGFRAHPHFVRGDLTAVWLARA